MKIFLLFILFTVCIFCLLSKAGAQNNQTVTNGASTVAINFPGAGCTYTWVNNTPGIGLPASGSGNIAPFIAVNTGNSPITATITATPVPAAAGFAYIANRGDGTISVINTATNKVVVKVIPIGPAYGVAVSPDGSKVYVANDGVGIVSVINTATNQPMASIAINSVYLNGVAVSPDGLWVYVANSNPSAVSVISTLTNKVVTTIPITGTTLGGIAVSPDGSRVYVVNQDLNKVSVINATTKKVMPNPVSVGENPFGIAVSPDGNSVYVANEGSNTVSVINMASNTVTAIKVDENPDGVAVSPDGSRVYVANEGSNTVSVINTATGVVTPVLGVGPGPFGVSVSADGGSVYVTNHNSNTVSVINTVTNTVVTNVPVGALPQSLGNFVTGSAGCGVPVTVTITVTPSNTAPIINTNEMPVIPNAFTPNGDGINDTWNIKYIDLYPNCTVQIYNRYGENVYSSVGYGIPWDGTYKGAGLPTATYYYVINLKNGSAILSGYVAIIK